MSTAPPPGGGKMDAFGVASVSVFLGHLIIAFWPVLYCPGHPLLANYPKWAAAIADGPGRVLYDGQYAVTLFFLLSGFVLSLAHFRNPTGDALASAAARRYLRLMLPAAASILLACFVMKRGWMFNQWAAAHMTQLLAMPHQWLTYFYDFDPSFRRAAREGVWDVFVTGGCGYNKNLWTMSIELSGSFLVYAFLALFGNLRGRWVFYLAVGGLLAATGRYHMCQFLLGVAVADLYVRWEAAGGRFALPGVVGVPLALAAAYAAGTKTTTGSYTVFGAEVGKAFVQETASGLLLVATTAFCPALQRVFGCRPLVFLGKVSFTLYLLHLIAICSLACYLYLQFQGRWGLGHNAAALAASAACLGATFAAAWVMYLAVDRPSIRLAAALYKTWFRVPAPPGPGAAAVVRPRPAKAA